MTNTTITIRDHSTVDGGGYAVTHLATCAKLATSATTEGAGMPGLFVQDSRYSLHTVTSAERSFRAQFTVEVPMRRCGCAERHLLEVSEREARLDAADRQQEQEEEKAELLAYAKYVGR